MTIALRPMRAATVTDNDVPKLSLPLMGSPKFDGWRTAIRDSIALTNKLLPVPNKFVQEYIRKRGHILNGLDAEIVLKGSMEYNKVQSALSRASGEPDFEIYYFDLWNHPGKFLQRLASMELDQHLRDDDRIKMVQQKPVFSLEEFYDYEELILSQGYEGTCWRDPFQLYKMGRSTLNQQALLKRKPFHDADAQIIGFYEQEENTNELQKDNLGLAKRSSHKDQKLGKATLGGFIVTSREFGEFNIGTGIGLTRELRQRIWDNQDQYIGRFLTFKYQKMGTKDKPRIPIFRHFRDALDIPLED